MKWHSARERSAARLASVGAVLAVVVWVGWTVLLMGIVFLSLPGDPPAPVPARVEAVLVTTMFVTLWTSFCCWLIALRLVDEDRMLTDRARRVWWILIVFTNLLGGPAYLTLLCFRRRRVRTVG